MRPKRKSYKNERYDLLRRLNCCTICKTQDERTRNGGALCEKCCMEKRRKRAPSVGFADSSLGEGAKGQNKINEEKGQTKLCL